MLSVNALVVWTDPGLVTLPTVTVILEEGVKAALNKFVTLKTPAPTTQVGELPTAAAAELALAVQDPGSPISAGNWIKSPPVEVSAFRGTNTIVRPPDADTLGSASVKVGVEGKAAGVATNCIVKVA